jgi:hypothetical protein
MPSIVTDRYYICPGSGLAHPQIYCSMRVGKNNVKFIHCPVAHCDIMMFFRGPKWRKGEVDGLTKSEIAALNPRAFVV